MCLAIFKPGNLVIPEAHLKTGWQRNCDGAGFAYVKDAKVQIVKGFMTLKEFLASYNQHFNDNKHSPFLIHFRIRTYGGKTPGNTHPFPIKGGALIHNGSISGVGSSSIDGDSDTALFARKYADVLSYDTLKKHKKDFEDAVGYNRIAFLYDDKSYIILNEHSGEWHDDIWYSNDSYRGSSSVFSDRNPRFGNSMAVGSSGVYTGD